MSLDSLRIFPMDQANTAVCDADCGSRDMLKELAGEAAGEMVTAVCVRMREKNGSDTCGYVQSLIEIDAMHKRPGGAA